MKKLLIFCITVTMASFIYGQDAKSLLNEVSNKVKSYDNITIDFKYNLNNSKEGVNQDTRGDVVLSGNKYVLNMLGVSTMFDGKKLYTVNPEDEEVTISTYDPNEDQAITPSKMLTFYENGYTYKMDIVQNVKGRKIQYVKLTPIDRNAEIKDILLGIDAQTKHIYKLIQTDAQGTTYTFVVNSFKTNQPVAQSLFKFDEAKYKNEGWYINKM